jgi:hypothetical protein
MAYRTVPYFWRTGTVGTKRTKRTVPYFRVPVRLGAKRPKTYRTVPPSYRRGTVVRSVRRGVRTVFMSSQPAQRAIHQELCFGQWREAGWP